MFKISFTVLLVASATFAPYSFVKTRSRPKRKPR